MAINANSYNVVFISEQALKDNSIINDNVDMKVLTPTIKLVQEIYLTRLLGSGLYVDLQDKIKANTLNADEVFLMNAYIQPLMVWGIMKEAPVFMTYKYMNKGVEKMNSDNSQPAQLDELQMLVDKASDRFDWYSQRLINYLMANQQKYPSYNLIRALDDVPPTVRGYRSRVFLGESGCDNCTSTPEGFWWKYR